MSVSLVMAALVMARLRLNIYPDEYVCVSCDGSSYDGKAKVHNGGQAVSRYISHIYSFFPSV